MFSFTVALLLGASHLTTFTEATGPQCKNLPGDPGWPTTDVWDSFNKTVDGRLIRTVPVGSPCHNPTFDADACTFVQTNWRSPHLHDASSSSLMFSNYANKSCDPFTGVDGQCVIGTYVQYAVNVSTPAHVIQTASFANKHNIRFVVRNSAHDLMGRSTGTGGLAVWMHNVKGMDWIDDYKSSGYNGPAVKISAGVQVGDLYAEADDRRVTVVAGGYPTIGFAGGYIQGAGHSLLSSVVGLAADHTLEFEVITTTGKLITASPSENTDLYWALSGGGGGTYGIVWSVTVKVFPNFFATSAAINVFEGVNVTRDQWWAAVDFYQANIPKYTGEGAYAVASISYENGFILDPLFVPNKTHAEVIEMLKPYIDYLAHNLSIPFNFEINTYPRFLQGFNAEFGAAFAAVGGKRLTSRLLPASLWKTTQSYDAMRATVKHIVEGGGIIADIATSPGIPIPHNPNNSVNPAWREVRRHMVVDLFYNDTASMDDINALSHTLTTDFGEALRELAPDSGAYINESDAFNPDWKNAFFGANYDKLLKIKDKYDPDGILYGTISVGGDRWAANEFGALCRT